MCGPDFCGQCTPSEEIKAYMEGRLHVQPVFGDSAQRYLVIHRRQKLFMKFLWELDPRVAAWPEYAQRINMTQHLNRLAIMGKDLAHAVDGPQSLLDALANEKKRILGLKAPNRRKHFMANDRRRVFRTWIREHLAEAEMLILGRVLYAKPTAPNKDNRSLIDQLGLEGIVTPRTASQRALELA